MVYYSLDNLTELKIFFRNLINYSSIKKLICFMFNLFLCIKGYFNSNLIINSFRFYY